MNRRERFLIVAAALTPPILALVGVLLDLRFLGVLGVILVLTGIVIAAIACVRLPSGNASEALVFGLFCLFGIGSCWVGIRLGAFETLKLLLNLVAGV